MRGLSPYVPALFAVALALVVVPGVSAGNPQVEHMSFGPIATPDDDFCGTGATVVETFMPDMTVWLDPNQPVDTRNHTVSDDVFTVPSTGVTVATHAAHGFTDLLLSGDPSGVNMHQWTFKSAAQITRGKGRAYCSVTRATSWSTRLGAATSSTAICSIRGRSATQAAIPTSERLLRRDGACART